MKIYITRHSLTAWNEEKRLQGWKDSPLTKQGKEDALKLGEYMKTIHIDQVYSSPLLRAKSTARLIFKNENINIKKISGGRLLIINTILPLMGGAKIERRKIKTG